MPTYLARCTCCRKEFEYFSTISERNTMPLHCGESSERLINAPMVAPLFQSYKAVAGDRRYIRNRAEHNDFLREFNYVEVGNDPSMAPPGTDEEFREKQESERKEMERDQAELTKIVKDSGRKYCTNLEVHVMLDSEAGTETSAPSIEDSLAAAFGAETPPETSGTTAEVSAPVPPASGEPNAALAALEAPKHWSEVDRTLFGKAPRDIQQRWIDREAEQTRGLDTKFQEIAGFRREREQYDEILSPFKRDLELSGQSGPQFVKSLVGWMNYLQTNPTEGLPKLMQTLGLDPKQLLQPEANTDPKYSELENRTKDLQKQLETFTSQAQQRDHQQKLSEVQAFADAKGEDGKPLRPFFDEVSKDILQLMAWRNSKAHRSHSTRPITRRCE
jgi:hypothetical protein